jgi:hypothetical protein
MATKAKRAQVLQIAFSSPFHNWHDMIRIPECLTGKPLRPPSLKEFFPLRRRLQHYFTQRRNGCAGVEMMGRAMA